MSLSSKSHKFNFIHIPKTGGSSIEMALKEYSDQEISLKNDTTFLETKHFTALEMKDIVGQQMWEDCFNFCIIRNPWDRVLSYWNFLHKTNNKLGTKGFAEWLVSADLHLNSMYYILGEGKDRKVIVDYVGRFETIEKDFEYICKQIGVEKKLNLVNKTPHEHYSKYYNEETKNFIANRCAREIEMFGYEFEELD